MYRSHVERPHTSAPMTVPPKFADLNSTQVRFWCRKDQCCASTTTHNDLARHYREYHPESERSDQPYDGSTYANSRHVVGVAASRATGNPAPDVGEEEEEAARREAVSDQESEDGEAEEDEATEEDPTEDEETEEAELEEDEMGEEGQEEQKTLEEDSEEGHPQDSDDETDAVMRGVATFGRSGPPFPGAIRPSLARAGLTRQQRVQRSTSGYLSGTGRRNRG